MLKQLYEVVEAVKEQVEERDDITENLKAEKCILAKRSQNVPFVRPVLKTGI